jgi:hypothetical protein
VDLLQHQQAVGVRQDQIKQHQRNVRLLVE